MQSFSKRLKEAMEMRQVNQTELSNRTGIDKSSLSHYLKGDFKARSGNLGLIAKALNVDAGWLMGYDVPCAQNHDNSEASPVLSDEVKELLRIYSSLPVKKRVELMSYAFSLEDGSMVNVDLEK